MNILPGTRVRAKASGRHGVVYAYDTRYHHGPWFPVTFEDGITQHVDSSEVDVIEQPLTGTGVA